MREGANLEHEPEVLSYRGIGRAREGQIGQWWSTNPYYSLRYSQGGAGEVYFVKLPKNAVEELAKDVSLEDSYQNYLFQEDPPGAQRASSGQVEKLKTATTFRQSKGPGGMMMKTPENAIEIGKSIFGN